MGVLKRAWTVLHQIWWGHCPIIATRQVQNSADILLCFGSTAVVEIR